MKDKIITILNNIIYFFDNYIDYFIASNMIIEAIFLAVGTPLRIIVSSFDIPTIANQYNEYEKCVFRQLSHISTLLIIIFGISFLILILYEIMKHIRESKDIDDQ